MKTSRKQLSKSEFVTAWKRSFSETNIKNGFRKCGMLPCDRNIYPKKRFNVKLLQHYDAWVENGKPEITADELDSIITEG